MGDLSWYANNGTDLSPSKNANSELNWDVRTGALVSTISIDDNITTGATLLTKRSRGTIGNPKILEPNDVISSYITKGFDGHQYLGASFISTFIDEIEAPLLDSYNPDRPGMIRSRLVFGVNDGNGLIGRAAIAPGGELEINVIKSFDNGNIYLNPQGRVIIDDASMLGLGGGSPGNILTTDGRGNLHWSASAQGPRGPQGPQGAPGPRGVAGARGTAGADGAQGPQGIQGPRGIQGERGPQGDTGPRGEQGQQAVFARLVGVVYDYTNLNHSYTGAIGDAYIAEYNGHVWIWTGTLWADVGPVTGQKGDTGATGATGVQGAPGPQGVAGPRGEQGLKGDKGDTGPKGDQGDIGPKGDRGDIGPKGDTGNTGPQGIQGPAGPQGATGAKGDTGDAGPAGTTDYNNLSNKPVVADTSKLAPGDFFILKDDTTVSFGQVAAQNITIGSSGIQIASTGDVHIMGAAGSTVVLGGDSTGGITFSSPTAGINYNNLTNKPTIPSVLDELLDVTLTQVADGQYLTYNGNTQQWVNTTRSNNLLSRRTVSYASPSLAPGASYSTLVTAATGYALYSIQVTAGAWVTVYSSLAARTADASRTISTDPTPGSGVLAETISTTATTTYFTPAVIGFNNDPIPNASAYLKITNNSNSTTAITVAITYLPLEA